MNRQLRIIAAVAVVGLLYAGLTGTVPMTGLEGLLLLAPLTTVAVLVASAD